MGVAASLTSRAHAERLALRAATVDTENAEIVALSAEMDAALAANGTIAAELDTALVAVAENEAKIVAKDAAIADKDAAIAHMYAAIAKKDATIAEKDAALAAQSNIGAAPDVRRNTPSLRVWSFERIERSKTAPSRLDFGPKLGRRNDRGS